MERTLQHPVEIRRIDHIVAAVRDLDEAGDFYCRLGFQVGTRNEHPWGTENRLIQSGVLLFYGPRTRPGFMSLVPHRPQLDLWFSKPALPHSRVDPNFQSPVCMG
jgi:catechol 2,3-dioxygenase-like lactoylglutathione lyase family enzyme